MINTGGRLFTFGCSVTQYHWPTWADIAGTQFEYFENWGQAGAGNYFIFNSIIECDIKHNLTPNDTVAIMWSAPARHDYFASDKWSHVHHVFNANNKIAPCPDGYWSNTFSHIYATDSILKSRNIPYTMASWMDYSAIDSKFHSMYSSLISKIQYIHLSGRSHRVPEMADIDNLMLLLYNSVAGADWPSLDNIKKNQYSTTPEIEIEIENFWKELKNDKRVAIATTLDTHPLPGEHLEIATRIFPELALGDNIKQWVQSLDAKLKNKEPVTFNKHLPERSL